MPDLIRNRVTERDIRDWLQENGFEGGSAVLESVDLFAIKRPGWKQLFRFKGKIRRIELDPDLDEVTPKQAVWGIALDDERQPRGQRTLVELFESEEKQQERLDDLSSDMLKATSSEDRAISGKVLLAMMAFGVLLLFLIAMVRRIYG